MDSQKNPARPSADSPPGSSAPFAVTHDGRHVYDLGGGRRLVLNPVRQAKKVIMRTEAPSGRQLKKARKALNRARNRERREKAQQEARGAR